METAAIAIISFISGGFLTALIFIFGWSNKITTIIDNQKALTEAIDHLKAKLDSHISAPPTSCPMHTGILIDVDRLKNKVGIQ